MHERTLKSVVAAILGGISAAASAGTITGLVAAKGPPVASQAQDSGAYQDLRYKFAERVDYEHLQDFVIYIDQAVPERPGDPPLKKETITQRDISFEPRVMPIAAGASIRWPNADGLYHNVFSMSETKSFDLGLYTKEKVPEVVFSKPGRVDVFCSIHSQMHCIILVLPSRYFAKASSNHRYTIPGVPAGTYTLRAWHERLPSIIQTITVPEQGEVRADFTLGLSELPKL